MTLDVFAARHGSLYTAHFVRANVAANLTNDDMQTVGLQQTLVVVPGEGSIIGIAAKTNGNVTAEAIFINPHVSGTEIDGDDVPQVEINTTNLNADYDTARAGVAKVAAGDEVGLSITTAAGFTPATLELDAVLFIMLQGDPLS